MKNCEARAVLKEMLEVDSMKILDTISNEQAEAIRMAYNALENQEVMDELYIKRAFLFCMTLCHYRTGEHMGKVFGVVCADSETEAEKTAWEKYGGDLSCELWVKEVPRDGTCHTIYKNMI